MKVFTFSIPVVVSIALMLLSLQHYHVIVVDAKLGTLGLGLQSGALLFLLEGDTSGLGVDFHRIPYSDFAGVGNFPEHPNLWDAIKGKFFFGKEDDGQVLSVPLFSLSLLYLAFLFGWKIRQKRSLGNTEPNTDSA